MIFDGHGAHKAKKLKAALWNHRIKPIYLPSGSCRLNPVEHLFGIFKNKWRRHLARVEVNKES